MKWMGGIVTGHAASPVHWNRYAVVAFVGGVCILVEVWSFDPCSYEYSGAPVQQKYVSVNRRRNNVTRDRSAHDYQRINIDFAGGVSFGSDQGMFVQNWTEAVPGEFNKQLYSANGNLNNNVIMHPAIAMGDNLTEGKTCVTTALWDWSPVASWDGGDHWPSWQTPDDGASMGYFGEGGGCYGLGESKNVICGK